MAAVSACAPDEGVLDGCRPLQVLKTILQNLVTHPEEDKYKNISLDVLRSKALPVEGWQLLRVLGFEEVADRFQINQPVGEEHQHVAQALQDALQGTQGILTAGHADVATTNADGPSKRCKRMQVNTGQTPPLSFAADDDESAPSPPASPSSPAAIAKRFRDMGFDDNSIGRAVLDCGGPISFDNVLAVLMQEDATSPQPSWVCQICSDDQEYGTEWRCPYGHRFCMACMRQHIDVREFPRCPEANCGYALTAEDLENTGASQQRLTAFENAQLHQAMDTLAMDGEVLVHCSSEACPWVAVFPDSRKRFACKRCKATPFCIRCRQAPYHYHADCEVVQALRENWLRWIGGGREEYFVDRKKAEETDKRHQALIEGIHRHNELEADEQWKAANCRLCPHCQRPVNKVEGCDKMLCGGDYHGGNKQKGCGGKFDWQAAKPYQASVQRRSLPDLSGEKMHVRGRRAFHPLSRCSFCGEGEHKGIKGLRFRCIHCEDFSVCAECEPMLAHGHEPDHVFEIHFENVDFRLPTLPKGQKVCIARDLEGHLPQLRSDSEVRVEDIEGCYGVVTGHKHSSRGELTVELDNGKRRITVLPQYLAPVVETCKEAEELSAKAFDDRT
eukprot:CAMPEP_0178388702 /NCGR_PEP_ID=MMETSP0689_2-20121128/9731_1 /TAXON_ID=160604 /ORGANISM="Amphidinium massartii, Strain CS-259" /LENGTH=615 /DNA_ID=CAMNT_0020009117 /DNA_START=72 /DNA_END=1919 /DNA_ORIENTATION=+